ncbi:MAG: hypothetical protein S0880_37065 [Actinomycetota bacterium]|nr:hypothetical protein [Actinomycetota bacterium]
MTCRLVDLTRGLAALAAIAALAAGVPALLWQLGGAPAMGAIDTLSDPFASDATRSEALLSGVLLLIAWVCWAQLAYALAIEAVAAARGRTARRAAVLPGVQALAARLVTSLTLITSSLLPTAHAAGAVPLQPIADTPIEATWRLDLPANPAANTTDTAASGVAVVAKTYTAGARDTFWSIAETTLSDGLRWTEIRDTNIGRTMGDGTTITARTETVHAGWTLDLPADAVLPLTDQPQPEPAPVLEVEVEAGDNFWAIADDTITDAWDRDPTNTEVADYWADVVELNLDRLTPPQNPNLIYPGQIFELPTVPADPLAPAVAAPAPSPPPAPEQPQPATPPDDEPATPPTTVSETPTSTPIAETPTSVAETPTTAAPTPTTVAETPATVAEAPSTTAAPDTAPQDKQSDSSTPIAALGVGALGVSAGALALTLRRRRARQAAKRQPGTSIEAPPAAAVDYETAIRSIADTDAARWIEATNRFLTHRLADSETLPAVIAMQAGHFGVELLLAQPCPPPDGFVTVPGAPTAWRLDPDLELDDMTAEVAGAHPYAPALLPVGRTPAGELLLDLERIGALALAGDPDRITAWQRALAVTAAATPWSSDCDVIAIGLPDDIARLPNVTAPDPAAWASSCVAEMTTLNNRLADTAYRQRVAPGEVFHPRLVLIGPGHDDLARQLADTATLPNAPLVVIAAADLAAADRAHFTDDGCVLEPDGLTFEPLAAVPAEPALVAGLFENADAEPQPAMDDNDAGANGEPSNGESVESILERVMAPRPIEVEILARQPHVRGLDKDIPTKQLSVLCYLAYHRNVASQRLRETFWPTATNRSTADNALSQLRNVLGAGPDGEQRLTAARNTGTYQLNDEIGCDWTRATELITAAKTRPDDQAASLLTAALRLVQGMPAADAGARSFDWLTEDPAIYRDIESILVDAAARLGEIALAADNTEQADQAARAGLHLVPGNEALYKIRLKAAATRRAFDEVDRLYHELCTHLTDQSLWDQPDDETEAIVRSAAKKRRRAS